MSEDSTDQVDLEGEAVSCNIESRSPYSPNLWDSWDPQLGIAPFLLSAIHVLTY